MIITSTARQSALVISLGLAVISFQAVAALPNTVTGTASQALITLATTGNPDPLQQELGGQVVPSSQLESKVGVTNMARLLEVNKKEHLAPKALIAPSGEWYAMVAPTITKDNFILIDNTGTPRRMDVGVTEGTNKPFIVTTIVEDGGTPWYTEFWYWLKSKFSKNPT